MEMKRLELIIFSALFVGLSVLTFYVFQPFLSVIVIAAVLSVLFHPLNERIVIAFRGSRTAASFLLVLVALIFLVLPVLFLGLEVFMQAQGFFSLTQAGQGEYVQAIQGSIEGVVRHVVPNFAFDIAGAAAAAQDFISSNLAQLLSRTTYIFFQIFFLLFSLFFFLRDGKTMLRALFALSPFDADQNQLAIDSVSKMITSVVRGTLFVGAVRFALIVSAFYIFGIPNAFLWGTIGGIIGIVPGLGTPFAVIPAFIYLFACGSMASAIGMAIFGGLLFFFVDNLLSAYFFGKGSAIQSPFILFSILGGIAFFGPLGFIFGPLVLSLFVSIVDIYKILVLGKKARNL